MKTLITGASGFIGSFVVEEALCRGDEVWAAVRKTSSLRYLQDERIHLIELDFADIERLKGQLSAAKSVMGGGWEVVIHCAGVTKCKDKQEFVVGNYHYTQHLVEALAAVEMTPQLFVYVSSLSIVGPIREADYSPICEADVPQPNTAYGRSKWLAEQYLHTLPTLPWVIVRPTGVYGPRERDYFLMAQSIKRHVDFAVGFKKQDITFVYVKDLVQAIYCIIDKKVTHRSYFVSDGVVYNSRAFSDYLQAALGVKHVLHITAPLWFLRAVSFVAEKGAALLGKSSTLNGDKYLIMKQRNWQCDIAPLMNETGYAPQYTLERGVNEAIAWYKEEKWL